ncbi:MAG: protein translocase subunit SecF [Gemmatimonadaceae bacterium]|jgi:preprotein translocase subunit SecF|nr:protein translocase subunit SecF [Gemmatimonadaceae bacterium]
MLRILHDTTFDFIKWWRTAAIATVLFIALGLGSFFVTGGVNYSIEFTGGTLMQLEFAQAPEVAKIRSTLEAAGIAGAEIQQFGSPREFTIRAQERKLVESQAAGAEGVSAQIETALKQAFGPQSFTRKRTEAVSPRVGGELRRGAMIAMAIASLVTLIYLAIRFDWRFGLAAVLSTLHDVLVTFAFIKLMHIEVSLTVVAAILTLLGYSSNDTIIIFDRVRENLKKARKESLYDTLNRSINETLPRSVMTHATTLAATVALLLFAGEVIRPFAWVMAFGVFVATFSSIYVAGALLWWIEGRFPREAGAKSVTGASAASRVAATPPPAAPSRPSGKRPIPAR